MNLVFFFFCFCSSFNCLRTDDDNIFPKLTVCIFSRFGWDCSIVYTCFNFDTMKNRKPENSGKKRWPLNHGYIIDGYIKVKVWCNFFAGVLCSTLDIGPWNLQFVFGFRKVNRCQRSIEKHCKSLKLDKI